MKKMRIASAIMAAAMSVMSMGVIANAADVSVKIGSETVEKGAAFSVDVDLSSVPTSGLSSIDFAISYDASVIKVTDVSLGAAGKTGAAEKEGELGSTLFDWYDNGKQIVIVWATGLTDSQYWVKNGTFLTISGKAVGSEGDKTDLKGVAVDRAAYPGGGANGDIVFAAVGETSTTDYTAAFTAGSVSIGGKTTTTTAPVDADWGDVNCDKTVDVADCVLLARFIAEDTSAKVSSQGILNADVTHDGKQDTNDVTKILKYVAMIITKDDLAK
ncbi:MAG: cohesin domain-containing protein [Oscillospiraceae bacterium]|nr:cohesin domain-containing protein [Oscillospiraceae bacterium]